MTHLLLVSVFVIATCGLVYELLAGTIASYLLGDSVTQFSTIIGVYLFSMGVGSYLAKFIRRALLPMFVQIEILVGLVGGCASAILFVSFAEIEAFRFVLYSLVCVIGILVGTEIPLLLRILKDQLRFSDLVSKVLSLDYLGALAASILFPLLLVPKLGLVRSSFAFGIANVLVALVACRVFRAYLGPNRFLVGQALVVLVALVVGFVYAEEITNYSEEQVFPDEVIYSKTSAHQRIVVTRGPQETRLYLNGHLQFSSFDEYRYHEALVHPGLSSVSRPRRALVLGGGDGMAVREILRDGRVEAVTLVDLDPEMTRIFRDRDDMAALNEYALRSPKVTVVNRDALIWLQEGNELFDFIVIDFPDPSTYSLGKLYSTTFYRVLQKRLAPGGVAVVQSTSPLFARQSFWCIVETIRASGLRAAPYHAYIPSFGEWGYVIASRRPYHVPERFPGGLRFLSREVAQTLFHFPPDMRSLPVQPNHLNNQILVQYYDREWRKLAH